MRSGTITFAGTSLVGMASERIVRLGLGLVPEGRHIFETLSVGENLKLGMRASRGRPTAAEVAALVDERFPVLHRFLDTPAGRLSGGEQQQLAIARAMAAKPDIVVLDEPSLGLAPLMVDQVFELIKQAARPGRLHPPRRAERAPPRSRSRIAATCSSRAASCSRETPAS